MEVTKYTLDEINYIIDFFKNNNLILDTKEACNIIKAMRIYDDRRDCIGNVTDNIVINFKNTSRNHAVAMLLNQTTNVENNNFIYELEEFELYILFSYIGESI